MWDLPRPGLEPMSPVLAGGFPTTAPPGKSDTSFILNTVTRLRVRKSWCTPSAGPKIDIGFRLKKFCRGHNLENQSKA